MRILVADDDAISRRMMEKMLRAAGYEVIAAQNGLEAADQLTAQDGPRLALIDWMMPELDGPALCRQIRSRHDQPYVYIILLTSRESTEDLVTGLEAGADDYLTKPCSSTELKARLLTGHRILEREDRLVQAREEMRFKATHDSLTSLWDRGAIMSLLKSELHRGIRSGSPVSVMLCDIDHFKQINDVHGHVAGDMVLQQIATRLTQSVRIYDAVGMYGGDAVGRYGGEEFLLILSGCDATQIRHRAENICKSIRSRPFQVNNVNLSVTASIGYTTVTKWDRTQSIEDLLDHVDTALYRAKSAGRNRAIYAESLALI